MHCPPPSKTNKKTWLYHGIIYSVVLFVCRKTSKNLHVYATLLKNTAQYCKNTAQYCKSTAQSEENQQDVFEDCNTAIVMKRSLYHYRRYVSYLSSNARWKQSRNKYVGTGSLQHTTKKSATNRKLACNTSRARLQHIRKWCIYVCITESNFAQTKWWIRRLQTQRHHDINRKVT